MMKRYGLIFSGIMVLTFTLSVPPVLFAGEGHMHEKMEHGKKSVEETEEKTVIDPVCGMKIKLEDAAGKSEHKGTTYYFCMDADKKTFDQDPEKYIAGMKEGEPAGEMHKHHEMEGHDHEMSEKKGGGEHKMEGHHEMMHGSHWMAPEQEAAKPNPVQATDVSIARGRELYVEKCAICHGQGGGGDGALAASLAPKPADLTGSMIRMHPDGDLFYKISKGKGIMPGWEPTLSEEDRWNLVNFIRSLSQE